MDTPLPSRLRSWLALAGLLEDLARETIKSGHQAYRERTRQRRGGTLRPGWGTPLWNELARHAAVELRRYGDKAKLARYLGLPRQRVHELFVGRTAGPDAERTLLLLVWLKARLEGRDLS